MTVAKTRMQATAGAVQEASSRLYGVMFNDLSTSEKFNLAMDIEKRLIKTLQVELIHETEKLGEIFNKFIKATVEYGKGARVINRDVLTVEPFSIDEPTDGGPVDIRTPRSREYVIDDLVTYKIRSDYSQAQILQYFLTAETMAEFINTGITRVAQTFAIVHQQYVYNLFGSGGLEGTVVDKKLVPVLSANIAKMRSIMKNKKVVGYVKDKDPVKEKNNFLRTYIKTVANTIKLATEKPNLTNSIGNVEQPYHLMPSKKELTVIANPLTMTDIQMDLYAGIGQMNVDYLKLPNVSLLEMSAVRKKYVDVIENQVVQIYPALVESGEGKYNKDALVYSSTYHYGFYAGILPSAFGIRYEFRPSQILDMTTDVKVTTLGEFEVQPNKDDLETKITELNIDFKYGNVYFTEIDDTHALMHGENIYKENSIKIEFTVKK